MDEAKQLAADLRERECIDLRLRVGLNSGQVISWRDRLRPVRLHRGGRPGCHRAADGIGRSAGGVILSESTARLVGAAVVMGERQMMHIKGSADAVPGQLLLAVAVQAGRIGRSDKRWWDGNRN